MVPKDLCKKPSFLTGSILEEIENVTVHQHVKRKLINYFFYKRLLLFLHNVFDLAELSRTSTDAKNSSDDTPPTTVGKLAITDIPVTKEGLFNFFSHIKVFGWR